MDTEEFSKCADDMLGYIANYFEKISERSIISTLRPGYLKNVLPSTAPRTGESFEKIMEDFDQYIMPGLSHWQHPGFHAYGPCLSSYPTILTNLLGDFVHCVGFNWNSCPSGSELETIVLDWFGKMLGLPNYFLHHFGSNKGGGLVQTSPCECVLICIIAARRSIFQRISASRINMTRTIILSSLVAYCSKESHYCVQKAAMLGLVNTKILDTDKKFRLRGETLAEAIQEDKKIGLIPFFVSVSIGTACGACDSLDEIGPICEEYGVWLNVDASYAGNALMCPEFRHYLKGIEYVSSFIVSPSCWLMVHQDCSLLFVRDRVKIANYVEASKTSFFHGDAGDWRIQTKETVRAFKLMALLRCYGIERLQEYIRNHVRLAKLFAETVKKDHRFEVVTCHFGIVCFRLKSPDEMNIMLLRAINFSGKLAVNSYCLGGKFVIRFVLCSANTSEDEIMRAWTLIRELADEILITEMNEKMMHVLDESASYDFRHI